jgi:hypothetical protein
MGYKGNNQLSLEVRMLFAATLPTDGRPAMKKGLWIFLALAMTMALSFGCTGTSKESWIKCPKCGTYFKTQEGADWFNNMGRF